MLWFNVKASQDIHHTKWLWTGRCLQTTDIHHQERGICIYIQIYIYSTWHIVPPNFFFSFRSPCATEICISGRFFFCFVFLVCLFYFPPPIRTWASGSFKSMYDWSACDIDWTLVYTLIPRSRIQDSNLWTCGSWRFTGQHSTNNIELSRLLFPQMSKHRHKPRHAKEAK